MLRYFPATIILVVVNVVVFALTYFYAGSFDEPGWTHTLMAFGAQFNPYTLGAEWYRIFLHMFLHAHLVHLAVNMFALFSAGREVESEVGTLKFVVLYILAGLGSAISSLAWSEFTVGVGASGAIFGLFGFSVVSAIVRGRRSGTPVMPLLINFIVFIIINVAIGEAFRADHAAHFGGLATGALIAVVTWYLQEDIYAVRYEYVFAGILIVAFFLLPRFQVRYFAFFRQVLKAEQDGKAIASSRLSDAKFLERLEQNGHQWDSSAAMLRSISSVPEKYHRDTATLGRYIHFRTLENDFRMRMIRDEQYTLMDSLEIVQDSISQNLDIDHPIPIYLAGDMPAPPDSADVPTDRPPAGEMVRVWYDSSWLEIDHPGPYYRMGFRDSLQRWQGPVRDFYADGKIQMKGSYRDDRRDGIFLYYSHHDTYTSAGRYINNRSVGKFQTFHDNGKLKSEVVYGNGIFYKSMWDSTGAPLVRDGKGRIVEYDGDIRIEGEYLAGQQEGLWMGWYPDGNIHHKEEYRAGRLVQGRSRDRNGKTYVYDEQTFLPVPRDGHAKLTSYLDGEARRRGDGTRGTVKIFFRVTAEGRLTDFDIERSLNAQLDRIAIDILKAGPPWIPARLYGYKPTDGYAWVDIHF